jgi:hypothetical protein
VTQDNTGKFVPNDENDVTTAMLSLVWQLRDRMHESATISLLFPEIMGQFNEIVKDISLNEKKLSNDKVESAVLKFFVVLALLVNRTPYEAAAATAAKHKPTMSEAAAAAAASHGPVNPETGELTLGAIKLQDLQYFQLPAHQQFLAEWRCIFSNAQNKQIPARWASTLRDPVGPEVDLDGTFFQCILDRRSVHLLSDERKQQIKAQLWHAGNVLRSFKNCCWPEEKYNRVAFLVFRTAFEKVKYLNSELIRGKIDFADISSLEREKRVDSGMVILRPLEAALWSDNDEKENASLPANPFNVAIGTFCSHQSVCWFASFFLFFLSPCCSF